MFNLINAEERRKGTVINKLVLQQSQQYVKLVAVSITVESIGGHATTAESIAYKNVLKTTILSTTMLVNAVKSERIQTFSLFFLILFHFLSSLT
jgi:hypothetical protein